MEKDIEEMTEEELGSEVNELVNKIVNGIASHGNMYRRYIDYEGALVRLHKIRENRK